MRPRYESQDRDKVSLPGRHQRSACQPVCCRTVLTLKVFCELQPELAEGCLETWQVSSCKLPHGSHDSFNNFIAHLIEHTDSAPLYLAA